MHKARCDCGELSNYEARTATGVCDYCRGFSLYGLSVEGKSAIKTSSKLKCDIIADTGSEERTGGRVKMVRRDPSRRRSFQAYQQCSAPGTRTESHVAVIHQERLG